MTNHRPVIPGHAAGMSPEPVTTALVSMGSGLAASLRPGMTALGLRGYLP